LGRGVEQERRVLGEEISLYKVETIIKDQVRNELKDFGNCSNQSERINIWPLLATGL
jgi:hypothetical protein